MTQITTQWIVEKINSNMVQSMQLKAKIVDYDREIQESLAYCEKEKLQEQLREIEKQDFELRELAKQKLIDAGMKKFEALDGTIVQLNKKPWALKIEDESVIPEEYKKEKVTISIDKTALKKDVQEWLILDGVYITEDYTLVIKN